RVLNAPRQQRRKRRLSRAGIRNLEFQLPEKPGNRLPCWSKPMKPRHMHVWRRLIVAASFVCFLLSCTAPVAFGQLNASDSFQHKVLEAKSAQIAQQAQAKFDGKLLYKTAFELLRDHHITLADQAARDKW